MNCHGVNVLATILVITIHLFIFSLAHNNSPLYTGVNIQVNLQLAESAHNIPPLSTLSIKHHHQHIQRYEEQLWYAKVGNSFSTFAEPPKDPLNLEIYSTIEEQRRIALQHHAARYGNQFSTESSKPNMSKHHQQVTFNNKNQDSTPRPIHLTDMFETFNIQDSEIYDLFTNKDDGLKDKQHDNGIFFHHHPTTPTTPTTPQQLFAEYTVLSRSNNLRKIAPRLKQQHKTFHIQSTSDKYSDTTNTIDEKNESQFSINDLSSALELSTFNKLQLYDHYVKAKVRHDRQQETAYFKALNQYQQDIERYTKQQKQMNNIFSPSSPNQQQQQQQNEFGNIKNVNNVDVFGINNNNVNTLNHLQPPVFDFKSQEYPTFQQFTKVAFQHLQKSIATKAAAVHDDEDNNQQHIHNNKMSSFQDPEYIAELFSNQHKQYKSTLSFLQIQKKQIENAQQQQNTYSTFNTYLKNDPQQYTKVLEDLTSYTTQKVKSLSFFENGYQPSFILDHFNTLETITALPPLTISFTSYVNGDLTQPQTIYSLDKDKQRNDDLKNDNTDEFMADQTHNTHSTRSSTFSRLSKQHKALSLFLNQHKDYEILNTNTNHERNINTFGNGAEDSIDDDELRSNDNQHGNNQPPRTATTTTTTTTTTKMDQIITIYTLDLQRHDKIFSPSYFDAKAKKQATDRAFQREQEKLTNFTPANNSNNNNPFINGDKMIAPRLEVVTPQMYHHYQGFLTIYIYNITDLKNVKEEENNKNNNNTTIDLHDDNIIHTHIINIAASLTPNATLNGQGLDDDYMYSFTARPLLRSKPGHHHHQNKNNPKKAIQKKDQEDSDTLQELNSRDENDASTGEEEQLSPSLFTGDEFDINNPDDINNLLRVDQQWEIILKEQRPMPAHSHQHDHDESHNNIEKNHKKKANKKNKKQTKNKSLKKTENKTVSTLSSTTSSTKPPVAAPIKRQLLRTLKRSEDNIQNNTATPFLQNNNNTTSQQATTTQQSDIIDDGSDSNDYGVESSEEIDHIENNLNIIENQNDLNNEEQPTLLKANLISTSPSLDNNNSRIGKNRNIVNSDIIIDNDDVDVDSEDYDDVDDDEEEEPSLSAPYEPIVYSCGVKSLPDDDLKAIYAHPTTAQDIHFVLDSYYSNITNTNLTTTTRLPLPTHSAVHPESLEISEILQQEHEMYYDGLIIPNLNPNSQENSQDGDMGNNNNGDDDDDFGINVIKSNPYTQKHNLIKKQNSHLVDTIKNNINNNISNNNNTNNQSYYSEDNTKSNNNNDKNSNLPNYTNAPRSSVDKLRPPTSRQEQEAISFPIPEGLIELAMCNDYWRVQTIPETDLYNSPARLVNIADSLYNRGAFQPPMRVTVGAILNPMTSMTSPMDMDLTTINGDVQISDSSQYLDQFLSWSGINLPDVDAKILLSGIPVKGTVIGLAVVGRMCTSQAGGMVQAVYGEDEAFISTTLAHEVGHMIAMLHDQENSKVLDKATGKEITCPQSKENIMSATATRPPAIRWSECSQTYYRNWLLSTNWSTCLVSRNTKYTGSVCGDGILDIGETCDCGTTNPEECADPCCNPLTCQLKSGPEYECSNQLSCCKDCKIIKTNENVICRKAVHNQCDTPEYCDGTQAICPINRVKPTGTSCELIGKISQIDQNGNNNVSIKKTNETYGFAGLCYHGRCYSHEYDCARYASVPCDMYQDTRSTCVNAKCIPFDKALLPATSGEAKENGELDCFDPYVVDMVKERIPQLGLLEILGLIYSDQHQTTGSIALPDGTTIQTTMFRGTITNTNTSIATTPNGTPCANLIGQCISQKCIATTSRDIVLQQETYPLGLPTLSFVMIIASLVVLVIIFVLCCCWRNHRKKVLQRRVEYETLLANPPLLDAGIRRASRAAALAQGPIGSSVTSPPLQGNNRTQQRNIRPQPMGEHEYDLNQSVSYAPLN